MNFKANKILIIATRRLGDVLLVTPLLRSLRNAYPKAQIDILVYKNTAAILTPLIPSNSEVDSFIVKYVGN